MRPGAKDPPAPSSSQAETPEIGDLPGTPDGIDDASGAPFMWRAFDPLRVYPQQSGLKRTRDQAFGEDPDTPKKDPKRAQMDAHPKVAEMQQHNQTNSRFQEPGTGTDNTIIINSGGQNGSESIIGSESKALVTSKGSTRAHRDDPDTVIMPWITFSTTAEGDVGLYRQRGATASAYGGFSDIFQCDARFPDGSSTLVAVKRLRAVKMCKSLDTYQIDRKLQKRLNREVKIWMTLQHPNIAPLLGFSLSGEVCIISAWFTNGNIATHLEANPDADRMKLIRQVAAGVAYLHGRSPAIVHGDLKPDNVLIDVDGVAKLIDFGLSKAVEVEQGVTAVSSTSLRDAGNARWIAPELLLEEDTSRSCNTDIFSFGDLREILTGDVPFKGKKDQALYLARYNGAQPICVEADYPDLQVSGLKEVLQSCWKVKPAERPAMWVVVQRLDPPPPQLGSIMEPARSTEDKQSEQINGSSNIAITNPRTLRFSIIA
ncbi:hypothetical protein FRC04_010568 [Tulasnella sp. 424]|nr:hypothetical protein FRC04_010568 [Tulasnella sp. 424]